MTSELFRRGGPHNIRKVGRDKYMMQIELPTDAHGMIGRECPDSCCSPGFFKVKSGTGVTGEQVDAFCPYCRQAAEPDGFLTRAQLKYAEDIAMREMSEGVERMMSKAFGLDSRGRKTLGGGMFSIEMNMKSGSRISVRRPIEEQLRRDVLCPICTLEHAVYGLAVWCPDCGADIFLTHVETEGEVIRAMLNDVERRSSDLGPRAAARDIENGLEDVVSIMEAALKAMTRRRLIADGKTAEEVEATLSKKVRNRYQSYDGAVKTLQGLFDFDLTQTLDPSVVNRFTHTLEKRHPIAHNLGIVDRKYLEKVSSAESEGRDVSLDECEVIEALDTVLTLVRGIHAALF